MKQLEGLSVETVVDPRTKIEVGTVTSSPLSTQGTIILMPGEGTRDASHIPGVVDTVVSDHKSVFVGGIRRSRLTGASVGTIIEQVKTKNLPKPYILAAHSAGTILVLDWLKQQKRQDEEVYPFLLNPPLAASWATHFFVTKGYRTIIPRLRWVWDRVVAGREAANYDPNIRTLALEDVRRVQAEQFNESFWANNRGRLRIVTNPRDLTIRMNAMRKIVPEGMLRTWAEYGISGWTAPLFGHDPMPAFGAALTAYKREVGLDGTCG